MKIITADDEKLVRMSLISMLLESGIPIEIIEEASNGIEMVEKIKELQPDIAFVDIQMPGFTGLEAIKMGKALSPSTQWIILTGFSEFNYARQAIELGASGYLLKPVSPDELQHTLEKALQNCHEYLSKLNRNFESEIISYYHGIISINDLNDNFSNAMFLNSIIYIDSHLSEEEKSLRLTKFCNNLYEILQKNQSHETRIALFPISNNELALVTSWELGKLNEGEKSVQKCLQLIEELLPSICHQDFSITLITSYPARLKECLHSLQEIRNASPLRTVSGINRKWTLSQLNHIKKKQRDLDQLSTLFMKLAENYQNRISLNYMKVLNDIEKKLQSANFNEIKGNLITFLGSVLHCHLSVHDTLSDCMDALKKCGDKLINDYPEEDRSQYIVEQVISYVDEHYMNDIGIGQIAQELHVTPNYLSTLFHKKTGKTFTKYLTSTRILKAKELLADPKNQVQKVAESVGYYSTRHFTKLFTELVGCYPSEYQKSLKKDKKTLA